MTEEYDKLRKFKMANLKSPPTLFACPLHLRLACPFQNMQEEEDVFFKLC